MAIVDAVTFNVQNYRENKDNIILNIVKSSRARIMNIEHAL